MKLNKQYKLNYLFSFCQMTHNDFGLINKIVWDINPGQDVTDMHSVVYVLGGEVANLLLIGL